MSEPVPSLRAEAEAVWHAAVAAARPRELIAAVLADPDGEVRRAIRQARRVMVVGAGKAGAAMSAATEEFLAGDLDRVEGFVNVPAECVRPLRKIRLHAARPAGTNHPTAEGVAGTGRILDLVAQSGPDDVALCLLSGGGSALLPAPVEGVSLEDKQQVTRLLHACGATINEMNAVRKHLSRIKGGRLAQAFTGRRLFSLIISDVIGDPLDVIASGPTAADPTTFRDALAVLEKYRLLPQVPDSIRAHLDRGARGQVPETLKVLPGNVRNLVIGNNAKSLAAARAKAEELGWRVLNLGSFIEGETQEAAVVMAGIVRSIRACGEPLAPPVCVLSGGETTVTLTPPAPSTRATGTTGLGGRNQEFALALGARLSGEGLKGVVVLSGGTDGEDGPTDAAGAVADESVWRRAGQLGLSPGAFLASHDAYRFFEAAGGLLRTGLTETNVMDVRVILVA